MSMIKVEICLHLHSAFKESLERVMSNLYNHAVAELESCHENPERAGDIVTWEELVRVLEDELSTIPH